jgi:O-antigen ligase
MPSLALVTSGLPILAIALPWLNPFASGPFPPTLQWVASLASTGIVLGWMALVRPEPARTWLAQVCAIGILLAALVSSVLGVVQYVGVSDSFQPWVNSTSIGYAFANLRQRNQFATLCNMGLACLLWWQVRGRGVDGLMAVVLGLGNATSSSRTGLVQLLALWLCLWLWRIPSAGPEVKGMQRRSATLLLLATLSFGVSLWLLPRLVGLDPLSHGLLARIGGDGAQCNSRMALWGNVLHLIAQKPWTGWGWGELGYAHYITLQPGLRFCEILDNAHNLPLQLAVELGLPVTFLVGLFLLALVWQGKAWRETHAALRVAWAVLAMILLHSLLEYPLWYGPFLMAAAFCLALVWPWRWPAVQAGPGSTGARSKPVWLLLLAAISLVGFAGYMAWEYQRVGQIYLPLSERAEGFQHDTLRKLQGAAIFRRYVQYAEVTTTTVKPENAARVHQLALSLLHFSAEPRIVEKLLDSAQLLGLADEVTLHSERYRAAFPVEYERWRADQLDDEPTGLSPK